MQPPIVRVHCPPYSISVCVEPLQLLNSEFDADPDPAFHFDRVLDLDPASKIIQIDADQGSATLAVVFTHLSP